MKRSNDNKMMYCESNNYHFTNSLPYMTHMNGQLDAIMVNNMHSNTYASTNMTGMPSYSPPKHNLITPWSEIVPTHMPWTSSVPITSCTQTSSQTQQIMQFTANSLSSPLITTSIVSSSSSLQPIPSTSSSSHSNLKRRNTDDLIDDDLRRPIKQIISEDKMTAAMNDMHITNGDDDNIVIEEISELDEEDEVFESNENMIMVSEEVQNALKCKSIVDKVIEAEIERSKLAKAVVLWQPPGGAIAHAIRAQVISVKVTCEDDKEEKEVSKSKKNNYMQITELNDIDCDSSTLDQPLIDEPNDSVDEDLMEL